MVTYIQSHIHCLQLYSVTYTLFTVIFSHIFIIHIVTNNQLHI